MKQPVVLEISSAMSIGGGEIHFIHLAAGLLRHECRVSAVVRPGSPLIPKLQEISAPIYELPMRNSLDILSILRLRRLSERLGAHVIHAHVARDYLIAAAASGKGRGLIITRHLLLPIKRSVLHRMCFQRVNRFIAVSGGVKQELLRCNDIDPARVVVIPNGVPVERFRTTTRVEDLREQLGLPQGAPVVGIMGQISPHKGHEDFVEAAAMISGAYPDTLFLVVGEESENGHFVQTLRTRIREKDLEKKFFFTGFLEDVPSALALMKVLAVPSWEEPFGLVVLEAMAAGVPVVATDLGGPAEILENGVNGLLVKPRAPQELAGAIASILSDPERANTLSSNALQCVQERYTLDLQVKRTADLIREVAALK